MSNKTNLEKQEFKKIPSVIVGAFIFNEDGELFLMKSPAWHNKYVCPGGHVEYNETMVDAVIREVKEETDLDIKEPELISCSEAINIGDEFKKDEKHLVFLNFKAKVSRNDKIILNSEGVSYRWLKPADWVKKDNINQSTLDVIEKKFINIDSCENKYLRALADYQNLLKQSARERQEFVKYANEQMLHELIPVYDNLKISLSHIDEAASQNGWAEGIKYVVKQFKDVLQGIGVEEIETVGKDFDHHSMEAMDGQGDKVVKEIKSGYKLNGKLIIPAKVILE